MESLWLLITNLGKDEVFIIALTLYTLLVNPYGGRSLGVAFALSYLLNTAIKYGLQVPRPFSVGESIASEAAQKTAGGPSMPSGHAQLGATLWLGIAAQLGRPLWWGLLGALTLLVAGSRLVLGVHRPLEMVVGLLLGLLFAGLAWWLAQQQHREAPSWRWFGLLPLGIAALLPSTVPSEFAVGLGMLAGFVLVRPRFVVPSTWPTRLLVGVLGLALVFAVYLGLSALPSELKSIPLVRALRYALLVLTVAQGVPWLLRRWLPVALPQTQASKVL